MIALYAMISRMRILSSQVTVAAAEKVLLATTAAYTAPNRTVPELHELIKTDAGIDPLREFAEAAAATRRQAIDAAIAEFTTAISGVVGSIKDASTSLSGTCHTMKQVADDAFGRKHAHRLRDFGSQNNFVVLRRHDWAEK